MNKKAEKVLRTAEVTKVTQVIEVDHMHANRTSGNGYCQCVHSQNLLLVLGYRSAVQNAHSVI